MERREFLATTGLTLTPVVAGCGGETQSSGGESNDESDSSSGEENADTDPTETEEPEPAEFELLSYSIPDEVEIDEEFTLEITIQNVGGQTGTYSEPLYVRIPDSSWAETGEWTFDNLEPGETSTAESNGNLSFDYVNRYEFRLGNFEETASIQVIGSQLAWNETFTTPKGYDVRVDEPEFKDTYRAENYQGEIEDVAPEDGDTWAFVNVYVKNNTGAANFSPLATDINLLADDTQYDGQNYLVNEPIDRDQAFDGGELQPGVEREGWIAYQADGSLSAEDVRVAWSEQTYEGDISVTWQSNP